PCPLGQASIRPAQDWWWWSRTWVLLSVGRSARVLVARGAAALHATQSALAPLIPPTVIGLRSRARPRRTRFLRTLLRPGTRPRPHACPRRSSRGGDPRR